jgi:hypothetical protein
MGTCRMEMVKAGDTALEYQCQVASEPVLPIRPASQPPSLAGRLRGPDHRALVPA